MKYHVDDLRTAIRAAIEADDDNHCYYGFRFADRPLNVGDICEASKDNPNRDDERDLPEYGTTEYDDLPDLDGTCAYAADNYTMRNIICPDSWGDGIHATTLRDYIYVIAGNRVCDGGGDDGEICIVDAIVIGIAWAANTVTIVA